MTAEDWKGCSNISRMFAALNHDTSAPQLYAFCLACCRQIHDIFTDERLRHSLAVGERYANGEASQQELEAAWRVADDARREIRRAIDKHTGEHASEAAIAWAAGAVVNALRGVGLATSDFAARARACVSDKEWHLAYEQERKAQCDLLREVIDFESQRIVG